jgi:pyruvate,water dikinase
MLAEEGLVSSDDLKIWMMAEIPSNVLLINRFLDAGVDGISIGSNDLTQLILGIDRDSKKLAEDFDELNDAVLVALERLIRTTARRKRVTCSICGQAPSSFPELTANLVRWGIDSVSVNPDAIEKTREIIAEVERKLNG